MHLVSVKVRTIFVGRLFCLKVIDMKHLLNNEYPAKPKTMRFLLKVDLFLGSLPDFEIQIRVLFTRYVLKKYPPRPSFFGFQQKLIFLFTYVTPRIHLYTSCHVFARNQNSLDTPCPYLRISYLVHFHPLNTHTKKLPPSVIKYRY